MPKNTKLATKKCLSEVFLKLGLSSERTCTLGLRILLRLLCSDFGDNASPLARQLLQTST